MGISTAGPDRLLAKTFDGDPTTGRWSEFGVRSKTASDARAAAIVPPAMGAGAGNFRGEAWFAGLALTILPAALHAKLSHLGFAATDEGFVLAQARRVLEGQVPHRDFITVRPALSALLHLPEVWLGGDRIFLLARFIVWVELSVIAVAWVLLAERLVGRRSSFPSRIGMATIGVALSMHAFPLIAWHTIDALALASVGLWLSARRDRAAVVGYLLLGAAALCKQNFVVLGPLGLIAFGQFRNVRHLAAFALPACCYGLWVTAAGGAADMIEQLTALGGFVDAGIKRPWASPELFHGLAAGALLAAGVAAGRGGHRQLRSVLGAVGVGIVVVWAAYQLSSSPRDYAGTWAFFVSALAAGAFLIASVTPKHSGSRPALVLGLAAATSWVVSLSAGYNSPALGGGPAVIALFVVLSTPWRDGALADGGGGLVTAVRLAAAALVMLFFLEARQAYVYRDAPPDQLRFALDDAIAGTAGIQTGADMQEVARDLRGIVDGLGGRPYALVPELPQWWVGAEQTNPLLLDWHYSVETPNDSLRLRAEQRVDGLRGRLVLIRSKYANRDASYGYYPILRHVDATWRVVGQTPRFVLLEADAVPSPAAP